MDFGGFDIGINEQGVGMWGMEDEQAGAVACLRKSTHG
jgi:hypothetical protein